MEKIRKEKEVVEEGKRYMKERRGTERTLLRRYKKEIREIKEIRREERQKKG